MSFNPQRILIVLHGSIGDVTRALPLANLLRRSFPRARVAWAVEPPSLPVIQGHPALDEVILFNRRQWWRAAIPFLRRIRAERFDLVLDLQRHFKSGLISFFSGAPIRLGFHKADAKEFNWIFNNHSIPAAGDGIPKLLHYLKFAEYLGIEPRPIEWRLRLEDGEEGMVARHLSRVTGDFAVLFAGTRWESKRWFADQIADAARLMRERYRLEVVLLGSEEDRAVAGEAERRTAGGIHNLVGRTSLREAIGIVARAKLAIGPDTGLMHLAAAVGTPVVSLWGATSALRTGPHGFEHLAIQGRAACAPCYLRRCSIGRVCMRSIDVEEIAAKADAVLSSHNAEGSRRGVGP